MLRSVLARKVTEAVARLVASKRLPQADFPTVEISDTKSPEHGDFACNFAMAASKAAGMKPRDLAEALAAELSADPDFAAVEVAGPGFINLSLSPASTAKVLGHVLSNPDGFYRSTPEKPLNINVEYVSVNPNGPITIGSGRGAAYGSTLCNVLEAAGHTVHREYYINDGVNSEQMRLFAESVLAILEGRPVPENGYKGDYVSAVAADLSARSNASDRSVLSVQKLAQEAMLAKQREDLKAFGTEYDTWFSEQSLHDSGAVGEELDHLVKTGAADDEERRVKVKFGKGGTIEDVTVEDQASEDDEGPDTVTLPQGEVGLAEEIEKREMTSEGSQARVNETLWLRSTKFGDDMDRVLRRRDGRLTYIASDVAYHKDKFNRPPGADKLVTILGPDHHGYIGRLTAVVAADLLGSRVPSHESRVTGQESRAGLEFSELDAKVWKDAEEKAACMTALAEARERLTVQIFQLVRFVKDGKPAPMRKRDGNIYALIDLINEIGEKVQPDGPPEEKQRAGRDVARFFYLMRNHDTTFDFDLDLAQKQSEDNPVFYAQYAHARICGVLRKAKEDGLGSKVKGLEADFAVLTHPKEKALIVKLQDLGYEVARCAEDYSVNRLATYAVELARTYHHFYDACRVIQPDQPGLSAARLALCEATRCSLHAVFGLLGVSAPERM